MNFEQLITIGFLFLFRDENHQGRRAFLTRDSLFNSLRDVSVRLFVPVWSVFHSSKNNYRRLITLTELVFDRAVIIGCRVIVYSSASIPSRDDSKMSCLRADIIF